MFKNRFCLAIKHNSIDHSKSPFNSAGSFGVFDTDPYETFEFEVILLHQFLIFLNLEANGGSVRQLSVSSQCAA